MSGSEKSRLHRKALTTEGLADGARIIRFNIYEGVLGEYTVNGTPVVRAEGRAIELIPVNGGERRHHFLYDMGVEPNDHGFNDSNFTVTAQDRALLPDCIERGYPRPGFAP